MPTRKHRSVFKLVNEHRVVFAILEHSSLATKARTTFTVKKEVLLDVKTAVLVLQWGNQYSTPSL